MTKPKETMNEKMAVLRTSPNCCGADEGDNGALKTDHPAYEGVDQDQQGELTPVLFQTEADDGVRCGSTSDRISREPAEELHRR